MYIRVPLAALIALLGLFVAARGHFELNAEQVGLIVAVGAIFYAYRQIAAHFDRIDHERHGE